jgi:hypothetical protein
MTVARSKFVQVLKRASVRNGLSSAVCLLLFASIVGSGGLLGVLGWALLVVGVLGRVLAIGLLVNGK